MSTLLTAILVLSVGGSSDISEADVGWSAYELDINAHGRGLFGLGLTVEGPYLTSFRAGFPSAAGGSGWSSGAGLRAGIGPRMSVGVRGMLARGAQSEVPINYVQAQTDQSVSPRSIFNYSRAELMLRYSFAEFPSPTVPYLAAIGGIGRLQHLVLLEGEARDLSDQIPVRSEYAEGLVDYERIVTAGLAGGVEIRLNHFCVAGLETGLTQTFTGDESVSGIRTALGANVAAEPWLEVYGRFFLGIDL